MNHVHPVLRHIRLASAALALELLLAEMPDLSTISYGQEERYSPSPAAGRNAGGTQKYRENSSEGNREQRSCEIAV